MPTVLVVYASDRGHTEHMARAHVRGIEAANGIASLKTADGATADDMLQADAVILGSPIHMGSAHWKLKRFIDEVCGPLWKRDLLLWKVGGVFACGGGFGGAGGGAELCMLGLFSNLAQLGFIMVPLPRSTPGYALGGSAWGPYCRTLRPDQSYIDAAELGVDACFAHGRNVATLALSGRRCLS